MSKRLNLRDFQQNLSDRLQDQSRKGHQISTLGVKIGSQHWLIEMADIGEVLPVLKATPLPLCKDWVVGMVNVRGNLHCVTDIAVFMNKGRASGEMQNRLLLLAERYDFNAAILVERVLGLRDTQGWEHDVVQDCYFDEQNTIWRKLDIVGLLGQAEFLQIGV
jgi:twitching motility protein PilI